jgi:hypothetical protein
LKTEIIKTTDKQENEILIEVNKRNDSTCFVCRRSIARDEPVYRLQTGRQRHATCERTPYKPNYSGKGGAIGGDDGRVRRSTNVW